jgi:putative glutathione S-transferase
MRRNVLYISYPCPFAHRANIVRVLKGLEDIIPAVVLDWELFAEGGWFVSSFFYLPNFAHI